MINIRFYRVMGQICAEATQWPLDGDGDTIPPFRLARIYRRIDGDRPNFDDLWLCIQDLMRDHCENGYSDDLSNAL